MDYRAYPIWPSPPRSEVSSPRLQSPVCDRPPPVMMPSLAESALTALVARGWEWLRAIARGFLRFAEPFLRFLAELGLLPATPAPVAPLEAPPTWGVAAAVDWASFGRGAPPVAASVPPPPATHLPERADLSTKRLDSLEGRAGWSSRTAASSNARR